MEIRQRYLLSIEFWFGFHKCFKISFEKKKQTWFVRCHSKTCTLLSLIRFSCDMQFPGVGQRCLIIVQILPNHHLLRIRQTNYSYNFLWDLNYSWFVVLIYQLIVIVFIISLFFQLLRLSTVIKIFHNFIIFNYITKKF